MAASTMRRTPHPRVERILLACLVLAVPACSVERHYRTLSFFFDGVPDPTRAASALLEAAASTDTPLPAATPPPQPTGSQHTPVRERRCKECHQLDERPNSGANWLVGVPELVAPGEALCARCHEAPKQAHVHGPVALGRCDLCHVAHQSPFPHLLRHERQSDLCRQCHQDGLIRTATEHEAYAALDCAECHYPHASDEPGLLSADWRDRLTGAGAQR